MIKPLEVTLIGIDGSGKSTTISDLADSLSQEYIVAHSGRPAYICQPNQKRKYLYEKSIKFIDGFHGFMDELNSKTGIAIANGINVIAWKNRHEGIIKDFNPEVIFAGRHRTIDSAVYSSYYLPFMNLIKDIPRFEFIEKITKTGQPDLLIYLQISPETAVARIDKRIEKEKAISKVKRKKWKHMHENVKDLGMLKEKFEVILDYYCPKGGSLITLDVEKISQKEVVAIIENKIRESLHKNL
jgi:thymidylate kinase